MTENRPTPETAKLLREELLFQRATQTYLWALPLINTLGMKVGSEKAFGAGYHVLPVWKKRLDARTLATTPNSDVIYAMSYLDLGKDGPMVFEAPPGLQGILLDFWQRPIPGRGKFAGDVGFFGPDGGEGGKFLILPPGSRRAVPKAYFAYRSGTNNVFVFLRSFYQDPNDLAAAVIALRSRERVRSRTPGGPPRQRPAIPVVRLARQAGTECRRQHRSLSRPERARGQNRATGSRPCSARGTSPSSACTHPPPPRSTRAGSQATSNVATRRRIRGVARSATPSGVLLTSSLRGGRTMKMLPRPFWLRLLVV